MNVRLLTLLMAVQLPHLALLVHVAQAALPPQGWVGTFHTAAGSVADGRNTTAFGVGSWGVVAQENEPRLDYSKEGMPFKRGIEFHCNNHSVNRLLGMLIGQNEGGMYSNANDTDLWSPLPLCIGFGQDKHSCPRGVGGMLQGAARWSTLARTVCPQVCAPREEALLLHGSDHL